MAEAEEAAPHEEAPCLTQLADASTHEKEGDLPEEPPTLGVCTFTVESVETAPDPLDECALLSSDALLQVASPHKAMVSPGATESTTVDDVEATATPLPREAPSSLNPAPFVAGAEADAEPVAAEAEAIEDVAGHAPALPELPELRATAGGDEAPASLAQGIDEAPTGPATSSYAPSQSQRALTELAASSSPAPQPPVLLDSEAAAVPPLQRPSPLPLTPSGAPPMLPEKEVALTVAPLKGLEWPPSPGMQKAGSFVAKGKSCLNGCLGRYSAKVVRHPCKLILFYLVLVGVIIVVCWRPFELDTDFSSFIRADGPAMRRREAYLLALTEKKGVSSRRLHAATADEAEAARRLTGQTPFFAPFAKEEWWEALRRHEDDDALERARVDEESGLIQLDEKALEQYEDPEDHPLFSSSGRERGRRLAGVYYILKSFTVIYYSVNGNALNDRVLRDVRDLELLLRNGPGWKKYCGEHVAETSRRLCDPGESVAAYAWPTQVPSTDDFQHFVMKFDGNGRTMLQEPAMMSYLQMSDLENHDMQRFFPKAFNPSPVIGNSTYAAPQAIRTIFTFRLTVGKAGESMAQVKVKLNTLKEEYASFIKGEVFDTLSDPDRFKDTKVYYFGDTLTGHEITHTLMGDAMYALGSIIFVLCYLLFHTQSILISISCLLIIFTSLPVAYVFTPASKTTIASFLSLFLITGVGSDVVFVFTDFWDQSAKLKRPTEGRIAWMIMHAGKSCFATSLTTSVSFFANLASVLQPLREFGLFMGLCVMSAFVLVLLFLPPLIVIRENCSAPRVVDGDLIDEEEAEGSCDRGQPAALTFDAEMAGASEQDAGRKFSQEMSTNDQKAKQPFIRYVLLWIVKFVSRRPGKILLFTGVLVLVFIIGVSAGAQLATGVPKIFPEDHNQVQSEEWATKFLTVTAPKFAASGSDGAACMANVTSDYGGQVDCAFYLCEAPSAEIVGARDSTSGFCWRSPTRVSAVYGHDKFNPKWQKLQDPFGNEECKILNVKTRIAGPKMPVTADWTRTFKPTVENITGSSIGRVNVDVTQLERLALENWETGKVAMTNFFDAGIISGRPNAWNQTGKEMNFRHCEVQTLCFFGAPRCGMPGWRPLGKHALSEPPLKAPRRLNEDSSLVSAAEAAEAAEARRLQLYGQKFRYTGALFPLTKRVDVTIVFGLRSAGSTPLVGAPTEQWSFDPTFQPENPWAQRAIYAACINTPLELKVVKTTCWIDTFRSWLSTQGDRFPSRKFDEQILEFFVHSKGVIQAAQNIWLVDKKVKATKLAFDVNVRKDVSAAQGIAYMDKWDKYLEQTNNAASVTANHAWHTAALFVRSEAEVAVIDSTIETIIIAAACGWVGMLIFTGDPWTACLVTSLVLGIISGLAFFMVVVMEWKIGAIEVISLVVFVGYSVTYSLHIAHNFVEVHSTDPELVALELQYRAKERRRRQRLAARNPHEGFGDSAAVASVVTAEDDEATRPLSVVELRRAKTRMSVLHVGGATLSSAMSTMGSSMFLLFCTLNIFVKLGSVVMCVTILSIVFALVPLPALLMAVGPHEEPIHKRAAKFLREKLSGGATRSVPPSGFGYPEDCTDTSKLLS
jgi:predicted RND superfamily exporter protein